MIIGTLSNTEFTNLCLNAIKEALAAGITPNYLFIEEALYTEGTPETWIFEVNGRKAGQITQIRQPISFSGMKLWFTKLPEGKIVVAVNIQDSTPKEEPQK